MHKPFLIKTALTTFCASFVVIASVLGACAQSIIGGPIKSGYILPSIETRVIGQQKWLQGEQVSLRIVVTNHKTASPVHAKVEIRLASSTRAAQPAYTEFTRTGETDSRGTLSIGLDPGRLPLGPYKLNVKVFSDIGIDEANQDITVEGGPKILLMSDKAGYQPGQTIHFRAIVIDPIPNGPRGGTKPIVFEVEDGRANKVFKKSAYLTGFNIAFADFELADEVNTGVFTIRATYETAKAEKKVRVDRYALPKFKVAISTDRPYCLPGEKIKGAIQAN